MILGIVPKVLQKGLEAFEIRGRIVDYWDRLEFSEKPEGYEQTCCLSDPSERQPAKVGTKQQQQQK